MTGERRRAIGALTIGQTPRDDVVPALEAALGPELEVVEAGALDGLEAKQIRSDGLRASGPLLVTRLRGGAEVRVREGYLAGRLQTCVGSLEERVHLIIVLCTGDLPKLVSTKPILYPGPLLRSVVGSLSLQCLGVLTPAEEQTEVQEARWSSCAGRIIVEPSSPYGPREKLEASADRLGRAGVDAVVMDCIGYTEAMKQVVRAKLGCPVLTATTLLARIVAELA